MYRTIENTDAPKNPRPQRGDIGGSGSEKEPQLSQGEPKNGVKVRLFKQISIIPWM